MPDMQKVLATKERILEVIRQQGPNIPVRVASAINNSNLFTAAFMSELVSENRLKISHMRMGASPLYYIQGQEEQLQKYTDYLNHKEKEAFHLLRQNKVLEDSKQEPAIRVALRSIKDFAAPMQIINKEETKMFWKIHTLSNDEAKELIEAINNPKPKVEKIEIVKEVKSDTQQIIQETSPRVKKVKEKKPETSDFLTKIRNILTEKKFETLNEILVKKKEFIAKVSINTQFGKQEFYLVAKDKKKISIDDIALSLQKAQAEKMPAIILSPGDIDKKAQDYYKEWRNLVRHEKISQ